MSCCCWKCLERPCCSSDTDSSWRDFNRSLSALPPPPLDAEPLSSVSSLEVHFDLMDLTELTDMSDQELAEVFADSDEETHSGSPAGKTPSTDRRACDTSANVQNKCKKEHLLRIKLLSKPH